MSKGRPKRTSKQWGGETRKRKNRFKKFIENPVIINPSTSNVEWKAEEEERFVPVYNWYDNRLEYGYAVSDYGNVISFTDEEPSILKQPEVEGYKEVSLSIRQADTGTAKSKTFRVHRLVWFSFTYDMLEKDEKLPPQYYEIRDSEDLKKLAKSDIEVHHVDRKKGNNLLSNLELLPEEIHDILHGVMDREQEEETDLEILKYLAITAPENQETAIAYIGGKAISLSKDETEKLYGIAKMQEILAEYSFRSGRTSGEVLIGLFSTQYGINEILRGHLEKIQEELPERTGKAITDLDDSDELDILITEGEHSFPKLVRGDLND